MNMRARGARAGLAQDRNKVQGVRPADGHNGCHFKGPNFGDLGMSPRQLSQNMACADGRLVTLITPPDDRAEALYRTELFGNRDG